MGGSKVNLIHVLKAALRFKPMPLAPVVSLRSTTGPNIA